jgi:hypothetical protein
MVLNYRGAMNRYIQTKMEFLYISSLGMSYRYVIKIKQTLEQKMQKFGPGNLAQKKIGKSDPNPQNKGQNKDGQYQDNQCNLQAKKDIGKTKKDTGKWCDFHMVPWYNTVECRSKKSLMAKVKASESNAGSDSERELEKGRWIIDTEPSATISTTKLQSGEPDEPEEGEGLFHSQM